MDLDPILVKPAPPVEVTLAKMDAEARAESAREEKQRKWVPCTTKGHQHGCRRYPRTGRHYVPKAFQGKTPARVVKALEGKSEEEIEEILRMIEAM